MPGSYEDIIHLPHHQSPTRPHMSLLDRAAQFAPFAALSGHDAAIQETARLTQSRLELCEEEKEVLNHRLQQLRSQMNLFPTVTATYFQEDSRKSGGEYRTKTGIVGKLDEYVGALVFEDGELVFFEDLLSLQSPVFSSPEDG